MPTNITHGLWLVYSNSGGNTSAAAQFSGTALMGLFPTLMFVAVCWYGMRQGWTFTRAALTGYLVWLGLTAAYQGIEWWLHGH
jgi:hypothetical protein